VSLYKDLLLNFHQTLKVCALFESDGTKVMLYFEKTNYLIKIMQIFYIILSKNGEFPLNSP
jgi:hypothetical protein